MRLILKLRLYFSQNDQVRTNLLIRQWLQKIILPALRKIWYNSSVLSRKKTESCLPLHSDLTNPLHPFNVEQRAMEEYNDRRAQDALYDYLQDSQRFQDHHRHDY